MQNKSSGQMWFYHAPAKPEKDAEKQLVPAASQIPGLAALDPMDQEAWEREVGANKKSIRDTDSNYIRLAKQGGRKNLLSFNYKKSVTDETENSPKPYPRVDWFDHMASDPDKDEEILKKSKWYPPEYMVYDEHKSSSPNVNNNETGPRKRAPFYTDNLSTWTRNENEPKGVRKNRKKDKILPEIERPPKRDGVSFSKLIGGEYGNEWYRQQLAPKKVTKPKRQSPKQKGYLNLTEYQEAISKKVIPTRKLKPIVLPPIQKSQTNVQTTDKSQFKLSKFSNVQSKLATGGAA